MEAIAETGLLVALDMMVRLLLLESAVLTLKQEVNPSLEDTESVRATVEVGRSLIRSALGESCS